MTINIIKNKIMELENSFIKEMVKVNRIGNYTVISIYDNIKTIKKNYNVKTNKIESLELTLSSFTSENYLDESKIFYKTENEKVFETKQGFMIVLD